MGCLDRRTGTGFTLVELLVGMAVSLLVALGAAALLGHSLKENRRLLVEARLFQDLRTSLDVIERHARRSGHWRGAETVGMYSIAAGHAAPNPNAPLSPDASASNSLVVTYTSPTTSNEESGDSFAFRVRGGALEAMLGSGRWQAMTDPDAVLITALTIRPRVAVAELQTSCSFQAAGSSGAAPRAIVRMLDIELTGRAVRDASIERTVRASVRVRNDVVLAGCQS